MKKRTKKFALDVIAMSRSIPRDFVSEVILKQLIRSATSVAANFRASQRGKSRKDFLYKINIIEEEADESLFWLEVLNESLPGKELVFQHLLDEANQLTAIFTAIGRNTKLNDMQKEL